MAIFTILYFYFKYKLENLILCKLLSTYIFGELYKYL